MPTPADILAGYYSRAGERVRALILNPNGKTVRAQTFSRSRAASLQSQIRKIERELKIDAARVVGPAMTAAYKDGRAEASAQAIQAGIIDQSNPLIQGGFATVDKSAVTLVARDTAATLNAAAGSFGASVDSILRQTGQLSLGEDEINRIIAGGIITGQPVEAIRELRERLRSVGETVPVKTRSGGVMNFEPGYYARMVVVTKTREAVVTARHERCRELGIDLVMVIGKPSNNFCSAFLGQVFSLSGKHPKFPAYDSLPDGGPPFHPNCSKGTRVFNESAASPAQLKVGDGVPDARKLFGMTPVQAQRAFKDLQLRTQVEAQYRKITPIQGRRSSQGGDFITDKEALEELRPLGTASVRLAGHAAIGDVAITGLAKASEQAGSAPASVVIDPAPFKSARKSAPLSYDASTDRLSINPDWPHWRRVAARSRENFEDNKHWSSSSPLHIYHHEIAHKLLATKIGLPAYNAYRSRRFTAEQIERIEKSVSTIAARNHLEFIAEVYSAKRAGRRLPRDILALYTSLEGP